MPGAGLNVPVWLLGSSLFSAQLAGMLGLPYAFASHFAPDYLMDALAIYRSEFRPSQQLAKPYVMVGTSVVGADSEEEARRLFTSQQVQSVQMMRGEREKIAPPVEDIEAYWVPPEREAVDHKLRYAFVGTVSSLADGLGAFLEETQADELIATVRIFDQSASLRSLEILQRRWGRSWRPGAPILRRSFKRHPTGPRRRPIVLYARFSTRLYLSEISRYLVSRPLGKLAGARVRCVAADGAEYAL